LNIMMIYIFRC